MINKSLTALTHTLFTVGSRHALKQGRYLLPSINLDLDNGMALYHTPKRGFFGRKKAEEPAKEQKENENTQKKEEPTQDTKKEEKATNNGKEQKKTTKEDTSSSSSDEDTKINPKEEFNRLLTEKPEGYENEIRKLFQKLQAEIDLKTKAMDELVQTLKAEELAVKEWHQKVDILRKSVKEAEEEAALTRKRYEKMMEDSKIYSISKFAKDLLEIPDNLERAIEAVKDPAVQESDLYQGITATHSILLKVLEKHGVTKIYPLKEKFDPNKHEALFDFEDPTAEPGTVGVVALPGYFIADRILRPAKVGVVKKRS